MSFPEKNWYGGPKGWEDLGPVEDVYQSGDAWTGIVYRLEVHTYCHTKAHIGKQNGELFKFCPRCMTQMTQMPGKGEK